MLTYRVVCPQSFPDLFVVLTPVKTFDGARFVHHINPQVIAVEDAAV